MSMVACAIFELAVTSQLPDRKGYEGCEGEVRFRTAPAAPYEDSYGWNQGKMFQDNKVHFIVPLNVSFNKNPADFVYIKPFTCFRYVHSGPYDFAYEQKQVSC